MSIENYYNLQILYDLTKINRAAYQHTWDLKAINNLQGLAVLCVAAANVKIRGTRIDGLRVVQG